MTRGPHLDDVVHQRGETHLDEADHGRAVRGDERPGLGVAVHIALVQADHILHLVLHFVDVGEAQLLEAGIDLTGPVLLVELADEGGRHEADAVLVVLDQRKVVLLDVDRLVRTDLHALAAVHTFVVVHDRLAAPDADGSRGTGAHTRGAAFAAVEIDLEGMSEKGFSFGHIVRQNKRSW